MDQENYPPQFAPALPAPLSEYSLRVGKARAQLAVVAIKEALETKDADIQWGAVVLAIENLDYALLALRR